MLIGNRMSSLTSVLSNIKNLTGVGSDIKRPLEWPPWELVNYLEKCHKSQDICLWHYSCLIRIRKTGGSPSLERLCFQVSEQFLRAVTKLEILKWWAAGESSLPVGISTDRHIIISCFQDISEAFGLFSTVNTDGDLGAPQDRYVVLKCLEKTYEIMLVLGWTLYPHGGDIDWLAEESEYLQASQLLDFKFDNDSDYQRMPNPTLSGVVIHQASVPQSCTPFYPQPPFLCRNPGPYGPPILLNMYHADPG